MGNVFGTVNRSEHG